MLDQVIKEDLNSGTGLWNEHQCAFFGMAFPAAPADSNPTTSIEASVRFTTVAKALGNLT